MKRILSLFVMFIFLSGIVSAQQAGLPNPASVKCEEGGYKVETRSLEDGSQYGVCMFEDSECGQWEYFREECKPKQCSQVAGYWDCEEGCKPPMECCAFKLKCTPYEEKGFVALLKKYFYLIFAWLWLEEEEGETSFEKALKEEEQVEF